MKNIAAISLLTTLLIGGVFTQTVTNTVTNQDYGTFLGFGLEFKEDFDYEQVAENNYKTAATGDVRTGNALFFSGGANGELKKSDLNLENDATNNMAVQSSGEGSAQSGVLSAFNVIKNSDVDIESTSTQNTAQVGSDSTNSDSGKRDSVGGVELQAVYVKNSELESTSVAQDNTADNYNKYGRSIAGVVNTFGYVKNSETELDNTAKNNQATFAQYGKAIAGIQNNVDYSKNSANNWENDAQGNYAISYNNFAVSGVQNNINKIKNNGNGNSGDALTTTDKAYNNYATSYNGKAIAGIQTNIDNVKNAVVSLDATAKDNKAYAYDSPASSGNQQYDAVSGFGLNIRRITNSGNGNGKGKKEDSSVTAYAKDNVAKNLQTTGGDAVAGIDVVIGTTRNVDLDLDLSSVDNYAYSLTGDAVAASRVKVNRAINSDIDTADVTSSGATAITPGSGEAVTSTDITINSV